MVVEILGVKQSESKGKPVFTYAAAKEYTAYEQENAKCEGRDVVSEFSYKDFGVHPGDIVDFEYEPGYQQKATLVNVRPIKLAENPFEPEKTGKEDKKETK